MTKNFKNLMVKLFDLCLLKINKDIKKYEKEICSNSKSLYILLNNPSLNFTQYIYKQAYLNSLIDIKELIRYAFIYNNKNMKKISPYNYTANKKYIKNYDWFTFDDIIDNIPISELTTILFYFPSIIVADKCIQSCQYNKLLLLITSVIHCINVSHTFSYKNEYENTIFHDNHYYNIFKYSVDIKNKYYDVIDYLLKINKEYFINNKTDLLPYNVNDVIEYDDINKYKFLEYFEIGRNIFHLSCNDNILLNKFLIYCGDNKRLLHHKDRNNDTPFYLACCADKYMFHNRHGNHDCILNFLQYGANIYDVSNDNVSIFDKMSINTYHELLLHSGRYLRKS
jgi:hypothetical protein